MSCYLIGSNHGVEHGFLNGFSDSLKYLVYMVLMKRLDGHERIIRSKGIGVGRRKGYRDFSAAIAHVATDSRKSYTGSPRNSFEFIY